MLARVAVVALLIAAAGAARKGKPADPHAAPDAAPKQAVGGQQFWGGSAPGGSQGWGAAPGGSQGWGAAPGAGQGWNVPPFVPPPECCVEFDYSDICTDSAFEPLPCLTGTLSLWEVRRPEDRAVSGDLGEGGTTIDFNSKLYIAETSTNGNFGSPRQFLREVGRAVGRSHFAPTHECADSVQSGFVNLILHKCNDFDNQEGVLVHFGIINAAGATPGGWGPAPTAAPGGPQWGPGPTTAPTPTPTAAPGGPQWGPPAEPAPQHHWGVPPVQQQPQQHQWSGFGGQSGPYQQQQQQQQVQQQQQGYFPPGGAGQWAPAGAGQWAPGGTFPTHAPQQQQWGAVPQLSCCRPYPVGVVVAGYGGIGPFLYGLLNYEVEVTLVYTDPDGTEYYVYEFLPPILVDAILAFFGGAMTSVQSAVKNQQVGEDLFAFASQPSTLLRALQSNRGLGDVADLFCSSDLVFANGRAQCRSMSQTLQGLFEQLDDTSAFVKQTVADMFKPAAAAIPADDSDDSDDNGRK